MLAPNNVPVQFQIDSAKCNVLPSDIYVEVTCDPNYELLQPTKASVIMYNGTREAIVGKCKLHATRNGVKHTVEFNVFLGNYTPILSLESCVALGFLKILDCDQSERVYSSMKLLLYLQSNRCSSSFKMCLQVLENRKPFTESESISMHSQLYTPKKDTGSHPQRIEGKAW